MEKIIIHKLYSWIKLDSCSIIVINGYKIILNLGIKKLIIDNGKIINVTKGIKTIFKIIDKTFISYELYIHIGNDIKNIIKEIYSDFINLFFIFLIWL